MNDVVIIGAGPAGLAAAYELSKNGKTVEVIEKNNDVGGLSRTWELRGCKFDFGPHVFFERNKRIVDLWKLMGKGDLAEIQLRSKHYRNGVVFGSFTDIFWNLSVFEQAAIVTSLLRRRMFPFRNISSCEDQMISDYGEQMYSIFHKIYHEKFWGLDLSKVDHKYINRMYKKISFSKLAKKTASNWLERNGVIKKDSDLGSPRFYYHKSGSGYMYNNLKEMAEKTGEATFHTNTHILRINHDGKKITSIEAKDSGGRVREYKAWEFISTIPLNVFVELLNPKPPKEILDEAKKLYFRNAVVVNLVVKGNPFNAQWLQAISEDITAYRVTNFSNLSQYMGNGNLCPIGIEYNCFDDDDIWKMSDAKIIELAVKEMDFAGLIKEENVVDASVVKLPHAYPIYFVGYEEFVSLIRRYLSRFENLQAVSRNAIYKYNNMGHAVESGLVAADKLMGKEANVEQLSVIDGKQILSVLTNIDA